MSGVIFLLPFFFPRFEFIAPIVRKVGEIASQMSLSNRADLAKAREQNPKEGGR